MRRLVTVVSLVVLMVLGTSLALAADINDVRQDHWAYESVKYLVDKGYIQLYDDGTFRGQEAVDRYGLASVLAKILKELSSESVDIAKGDLELLRKLTVEFREELVALSLRSGEVESAFGELEKSIKVIWEDVALMTESTDVLRQETADTIEGLRAELASIRAEAASVRAETSSLRSDLDAMTSDILANQSHVVGVKSEVEKLKEGIDSVHAEIGDSETKVIQLQESLGGLEGTMGNLKDSMNILDASLSNSLRRESELRKQLTELNMAFDEYKKDTQKQIETLRMYVIIGVIIGIVIR